MNTRFAILAISLSLATTGALAQSQAEHSKMKGMDMSAQSSPKTAESAASMTEGEVRKVDKEQGKITLKHGEIKNLGMPGMTMIFRVQDKAMLDQVKEGDKVRFTADNIDNQLTVTKIEAAR